MVDDVNCSLYADGVWTDLGVVPTLKVVTHTKVNHLYKYSRNRNYEMMKILFVVNCSQEIYLADVSIILLKADRNYITSIITLG